MGNVSRTVGWGGGVHNGQNSDIIYEQPPVASLNGLSCHLLAMQQVVLKDHKDSPSPLSGLMH